MHELQTFQNEEFGSTRVLTIDGNPWFVGRDVATILGYSNSRKALADHVDGEDKGVTKCDTLGGIQDLVIINESGLYSLILSSKLPSARKFKHWITSEVLPEIRKTGAYTSTGASRPLTVDDYLKVASIIASCRNERLGYVLSYLEQAGFKHHIHDVANGRDSEMPIAAVNLIRQVKCDRELTNAQIGRVLGIDRVQISRYVNGKMLPTQARAAYILSKLKEEV